MAEIRLFEPQGGGEPIELTPSPEAQLIATPSAEPTAAPAEETSGIATAVPSAEPTADPAAMMGPTTDPVPVMETTGDSNAVFDGGTSTAVPEELTAGKTAPGVLQVSWLGALVLCIAVAALTAFVTRRISKRRMQRKKRFVPSQMPRTQDPKGMSVAPETVTGMSIGNMHCVGARENQEDAFGISDISDARLCHERGVLCVVADGMGGLSKGEEISSAVVGAMRGRFQSAPVGCSQQQLLLSLVEQANEDVNMLTGGVAGQCGSTVVAVLVRDGLLWFASVGDSRICLCRGGGLVQLTREHNYAVDLDRSAGKGTITFGEAEDNTQRHALTRYIGMGALEGIDFNPRPVRLLPGDYVILMSDGVFNTLDDGEIARALCCDAQKAAVTLENAVKAKRAPRQDNYTAIILQMK